MSQKFNIFKITYYSLAVLAHLFIINWANTTFPIPFFKRICYLTNISLYLDTIYFITMLLVHLKLIEFHRSVEIGYFKFCYLMSFVVFILYWGIILTNPELLMPKDVKIPLGLDLFLHGANFILNLLEAKVINPRENFSFHFLFYLSFCVVYGTMLKVVLHVFDWVVYPFVSVGHVEYFVVMLMALGLVMLGDLTYYILTKNHHHYYLHANQAQLKKELNKD
jgi:hypothetical protein